MKKYLLQYNLFFLLALCMTTVPKNSTDGARIVINEFGRLVQEMMQNFEKFLSKRNGETFRKHLAYMDATLERYPLVTVLNCKPQSELERQACSIVRECRKPFFETRKVLYRFAGKNKQFAGALVKELREALPLGKLFLDLKLKLKILHEKATLKRDLKLAQTIQYFLRYIDQKVKTWNSKSPLEIFGALRRRMELS